MQQVFNRIFPWSWAAVWLTLPISMKANSISLIVFGIVAAWCAFYYKPAVDKRWLVKAGLFILLFAWQVISTVIDDGSMPEWKTVERKLSLLMIPVLLWLTSGNGQKSGTWAIRGLFAGLIISGSHMLFLAIVNLISGQSFDMITYHAFTGPYSLGAIYYSLYLSAALYYLAFRTPEPFIARYSMLLGLFFLILLLLCASKLFILLTLPAIFSPLFKILRNTGSPKKYLLPLLILVIILIGSFPFLKRVSELRNTDLNVVTLDHYRYDTPLNGITYRLVLWRLAGEILNGEKAWLTGTGLQHRQDILDQYYKNYGLYTGNPELGDTGYLGYNFHNQYLEILVGSGIPGLVILLLIFPGFLFLGDKNLFFPKSFYGIIFVFFMTESVLERQAGLVFLCLLLNLTKEHSLIQNEK